MLCCDSIALDLFPVISQQGDEHDEKLKCTLVDQHRHVSRTIRSNNEKHCQAPRQIPSAVSPKSQPANPQEDLSMTTSSSFLEDDRMRLLPNSQLQIFGRTKHPGIEPSWSYDRKLSNPPVCLIGGVWKRWEEVWSLRLTPDGHYFKRALYYSTSPTSVGRRTHEVNTLGCKPIRTL